MWWEDQGDESRLLTVCSQYSRVFAGARWMMHAKQDEVSVRGRGGKTLLCFPRKKADQLKRNLRGLMGRSTVCCMHSQHMDGGTSGRRTHEQHVLLTLGWIKEQNTCEHNTKCDYRQKTAVRGFSRSKEGEKGGVVTPPEQFKLPLSYFCLKSCLFNLTQRLLKAGIW